MAMANIAASFGWGLLQLTVVACVFFKFKLKG